MSETTRESIRAIAEAPAARREYMINDFLAARMGLFRQIGRTHCVRMGVSVPDNIEDFASIVSIAAYNLLLKLINDKEELEALVNFDALLHLDSKPKCRSYADRELTPGSGMTSAMRRVRLLNATRDRMRQSGHEPTDAEVVARHNETMWETRSNPVKQGMIATVEDLRLGRDAVDIDDHQQDLTQPIDSEFVLHPVEGPKFLKLLVERTTEYNAVLGQAADLWLSGLFNGPEPRIASVKEVAAGMGISTATARSHIRKIKEHAMRVAAEEFGITEDDVY